jgi:acyl-CoA reductase-like NAD-dependent aldehyde dehydrogenase
MTADSHACEPLISRNPANGQELGRFPVTSPEAVAEIVARATLAQKNWAALPWNVRKHTLERWWAGLARDAEVWAVAIRDEIGKPTSEAMAEVVSTLDALRWTVKNSQKALADQNIGRGWQRTLLIPPASLHWVPLGVIGIVGTWNYPLLLSATAIAQSLAAGNAVVWKPSEQAIGLGRKLQDSIDAAGLPDGLVSAIYGGREIGQSLIRTGIAKAIFTGGIAGGRAILGELGHRGDRRAFRLRFRDHLAWSPARIDRQGPDLGLVRRRWSDLCSGQANLRRRRSNPLGRDPRLESPKPPSR